MKSYIIKYKNKYVLCDDHNFISREVDFKYEATRFSLKSAIMEIIAWSDNRSINDFELIQVKNGSTNS